MIDQRLESELLIREARRRQRRRQLATLALIVAAAIGAWLATRPTGSHARPRSLLSRPLHLPSLRPGERCPVSSGYLIDNQYFGGSAIGRGPVRLLLAQAGDYRHGRFDLGATFAGGWHALQTLWFALPGYGGPFVVRAARLDARGPVEVRPGATAFAPGSGPLLVPAGPTVNSYPAPTGKPSWAGYRAVPGSTWVKSPGCYAWQVDGRGFSDVLVARIVAAQG